jgi:hypothetical protein
MDSTILFLILQIIFFIFQYFTFTKLTVFQYSELVFTSIFIIIFFGVLGAMITLNKDMINISTYGSVFFMMWYYITKKITNGINSDINGVIYFS